MVEVQRERQHGAAGRLPVDGDQAEMIVGERRADAVAVDLVDERHGLGARGGQLRGKGRRGGFRERGTREFVDRVARVDRGAIGLARGVEAAQFAGVAVAREQDHAGGAGGADQLEEAPAFGGKVAPFLEAVVVRNHLDGTHDHPHVGRLTQHGLQPAPLVGAEHRCRGIRARQVRAPHPVDPPGRGRVAPAERRAEITRIEGDDLHDAPRRTVTPGGIDAGTVAPRAVGRHVVEIEKVPLRLNAPDKVGPAVVLAVVVIVPRTDNAGAFAEETIAREVALPRVVIGHAVERDAGASLGRGAGRARRVGIHGVAEPDPRVGVSVDHGVPDGRGIERRTAGTEGQATDERTRLGGGIVRGQRTGSDQGEQGERVSEAHGSGE